MDIILRDRLKFLKLIEWMNENDMLNNDLGLVDYEVAEIFQETDTYKNFQASEKASNCILGYVSECNCGENSTGYTEVKCCNICGLPIETETWHCNWHNEKPNS